MNKEADIYMNSKTRPVFLLGRSNFKQDSISLDDD